MAAAPKSTAVGAERASLSGAALAKDTLITAILCLAILGPIVGLKVEPASGGLVLAAAVGHGVRPGRHRRRHAVSAQYL